MIIQNPIVKGFYPDPSICKANNKYYMVCSSFHYFPAVPLFESEDGVHFTQIGHCFTKASQVNLKDATSSAGVFAATIRFHQGIFYVVTTNTSTNQNFYCTSDNIYEEFSDPIFVDQGGIDPSLYFEDDITYFMSNGTDVDGSACILQCEIQKETGKRLTESIKIWKGTGGKYLESPHLYKFNDIYYLLAAEGGTEYGHMITYAKGSTPYGPFENAPNNPLLTNRNLGGNQSLLQGIGHGDFFQDDKGNTFIICLGFRQISKWSLFHHLGREVFLAQVFFQEDGWIRSHSTVSKEEVLTIEGTYTPLHYNVTLDTLNTHRLCYLRTPNIEDYRITTDSITLQGSKDTLKDLNPTFVGIRQSEFNTLLSVDIQVNNCHGGITYYMDEQHHYAIEVTPTKVQLLYTIGTLTGILKEVDRPSLTTIKVLSCATHYDFYVNDTHLGTTKTKYLSSEVAEGFTGVVLGFYAYGDGTTTFTALEWIQKEQ